MKQAFIFSLKVWLTTLLLAPLLSNLVELVTPDVINYNLLDALSLAIIEIMVGAFLSMISFLFLFLFTYLFIKQDFVEHNVKVILSFICVILILVPFLGLFHFNKLVLPRMIIYSLIGVASIWVYKLIGINIANVKPVEE